MAALRKSAYSSRPPTKFSASTFIKLPGRDTNGTPVWLPIDAKFPVEDYNRVVEASERGDVDAVDKASRQLELTLKLCAKNLSDKYIAPPATIDFGILFLSTEGLYAEAMRRPALSEFIQREYRIVLAGPSTLAAMLNSFQMGFRTLAIRQRSSEVWELLGAVKSEFGKYADVLAKIKKKLGEAQNTIDRAETRTRAIHRELRDVETGTASSRATARQLAPSLRSWRASSRLKTRFGRPNRLPFGPCGLQATRNALAGDVL